MNKKELMAEIKRMGETDEKVLDALEKVDRSGFVPEDQKEYSHENYPLPIGGGQTISQPYTVAYMLELLDIRPGDRILEIGAGSGYNAALMSHLVKEEGLVVTIELDGSLCSWAKQNLIRSGHRNVRVICADGFLGYEDESPYDRIILTCGSREIPPRIMQQLKKDGILVMPLSDGFGEEMIRVINSEPEKRSTHGRFAFVPLRRLKQKK